MAVVVNIAPKLSDNLTRDERYRMRHPDRVKAANKRYADSHKREKENKRLMKEYGLTREEWDQILISQAGRCNICRWGMIGRANEPCIDHPHLENWNELPPEEKKRLIRGMTCHSCNAALGLFQDSIEVLKSAIVHLRGRL